MKRTPIKSILSLLLLLLLLGPAHYALSYYDPGAQRWINRDPIEELGGINQYAFLQNAPPLHVDPYGRSLLGIGIGIGIGVGAAICIDMIACRLHIASELVNAETIAATTTGTQHVDGSPADAVLHCIASCNLAQHPGACLWASRTHSILNGREDGRSPASRMDIANNDVGYRIGMSGGAVDCTADCTRAWRLGLLYTVANGQVVQFPQTGQ